MKYMVIKYIVSREINWFHYVQIKGIIDSGVSGCLTEG